jgi:undecaprenol kinase/diacylglycerol kinase (ATP)
MRKDRYSLKSFAHAFAGLKAALRHEVHMKIHLLATFVVIIGLCLFHQTQTEVLFVGLAIALVWITELMNTAIEKTVDLAMPNVHPLAKLAKDLAAGAVLVAALFAVFVALIVFMG